MSPEQINPTEDRILVRLIDPEDVTDGGIFIAETARGESQRGIVLKVGPGHRPRKTPPGTVVPLSVRPGDTVVFDKYAGGEIALEESGDKDQRVLRLMREREILAVLEES